MLVWCWCGRELACVGVVVLVWCWCGSAGVVLVEKKQGRGMESASMLCVGVLLFYIG